MPTLKKLLEAEKAAEIAYRQAVINHRGQAAALARWKKAKGAAMLAFMAQKKEDIGKSGGRCNMCGVFIQPKDRNADGLCDTCREALTKRNFAWEPGKRLVFDNVRPASRNRREVILDQARINVCGYREQDYGNPERNFTRIAAMWSAYLGHDVNALDVANMMVLLKVARSKSSPKHADNFIDMAGYAACGGEIGDNLP